MTYCVLDQSGKRIDAHFDVLSGALIYHARGGARGTSSARNVDYKFGLIRILESLTRTTLPLARIYVDSSTVQHLEIEDRTVLTSLGDWDPVDTVNEVQRRAAAVGRTSGSKGGNGTKRLRIVFQGSPSRDTIVSALPCSQTEIRTSRQGRLSADTLKAVDARYVFEAVEQFRFGNPPSKFGPSTDYDLVLEDGTRLPPKAVFGVAASNALGFEVEPRHFSGGVGTPCFQALEAAGFEIVPKGENAKSEVRERPPPSDEEMVWVEGGAKVAKHLIRERHRGLSSAKKRAFRDEHGKLFCEKCGLDPNTEFGDEDGEACMEVHHKNVTVAEMGMGHITRLEDTELLCANCHRVEHARLRKDFS